MKAANIALFASLLLAFLSAPLAASTAEIPLPEDIVEETADRVFTVLNDNLDRAREEPQFLYDLVEEAILPLVDFTAISRLVLGTHWRQATAGQRERFIETFRDTLVRAYAVQLVDHADKRIIVQRSRRPPDETIAVVHTEIVVGQGRPNVPVSYSMRYTDGGGWRAYDLTVEGLSFVRNFRTSFDAEIRDHGLDALIDRLANSDEIEVPTQ